MENHIASGCITSNREVGLGQVTIACAFAGFICMVVQERTTAMEGTSYSPNMHLLISRHMPFSINKSKPVQLVSLAFEVIFI